MAINLIPEEKMTAIKNNFLLGLIQKYVWLILILLTLLNIETRFGSLLIEKASQNLDQFVVSPLDEQIRKVNRQIEAVTQVNDRFIKWSVVLNQLSNTASININFQSVTLDSGSKILILTGTAATRQDLLDFKSRLTNSPFLKEVDLPLENLLKKENVGFQISAKLDLT